MGNELNVYKFGGTSQKDTATMNLCADILARDKYARGVVVSAPAGVTDLLHASADLAFYSKKLPDSLVAQIMDKYAAVTDWLPEQQAFMDDLYGKIYDALIVDARTPGPQAKEKHKANVAALGELVQYEIFANFLKRKNMKVNILPDDTIRLQGDYIDGTYDRKSDAEIRKCMAEDGVLVMYGYAGMNEKGEAVVFSRGGSNYTLTLAARAVNATAVYNYSDVDGIMTINPTILPTHQKHLARTISDMSYAQTQEITWLGATILHPITVEPLIERGIPMYVLNTFNPNGPRTKIHNMPLGEPRFIAVTGKKGGTGISKNGTFTSITIHAGGMEGGLGYAQGATKVFFEEGIDIDTMTTSSVDITFSFSNTRKDLSTLIEKLSTYGEVTTSNSQSIISMIGEDIGNNPYLLADLFTVLGDEKIAVNNQISKANNHSFSFCLDSRDFETTKVALHNRLLVPENAVRRRLK